MDDVLQEVCRMLEPFNKAKKPIGGDTDFLQDLDIDSLAIMNFIMKLEDRFDISIPLNVLPEMRTVDDLVATIHRVRGDA